MADAAPSEAPYRVAIVGTGGVGGYLAARLANTPGWEVHCICRGANLEAIKLWGLRVTSIGGNTTARSRHTRGLSGRLTPRTGARGQRHALARGRGRGGPGDSGTENVAAGRAPAVGAGAKGGRRYGARAPHAPSGDQVGPRTLVLPTQNGVETPEVLGALVGAEHVLGGYSRITSLLTGPGELNHIAIQPVVQGAGVLPTSGQWAAEELARCAKAFAVRSRLTTTLAPPSRAPAAALRAAAPERGRGRVAADVEEADDDGALLCAVRGGSLPHRPAAGAAGQP